MGTERIRSGERRKERLQRHLRRFGSAPTVAEVLREQENPGQVNPAREIIFGQRDPITGKPIDRTRN